MPIYEYRCSACGRLFERFERVGSEHSTARCPDCGGDDARRVPSRFASTSPARPGPRASSCASGST